MISSLHPHSMCKKVERVTAKTGCTSCTKQTISFKVSGFHMETRLLQRDFIFLNLFELLVFLCSKCTIQSHIIDFQPFLTSFVIFLAFTDFLSYKTQKFKSTTNELWKGWKLAWYHHFTHIECAKFERVTAKTGCTSCTKRTISFDVSGFHTETRLV